MMKHYFILALRNLIKLSINTVSSIIGLILGISSTIFLLLYMDDEIKYSNFDMDKAVFIILFTILILVAVIIYINLYSFILIKRAKEISIRKALGASKWDLFKQFFIDSLLRVSLILLISLTLVDLMLPIVNALIERNISLKYDIDYKIVFLLILSGLFYGWLGGFYVKITSGKFTHNLL